MSLSRHGDKATRSLLPAALPPLLQVRALGTERCVLPWPGYTHISSGRRSKSLACTPLSSDVKRAASLCVLPAPPGNRRLPRKGEYTDAQRACLYERISKDSTGQA